MEAKRNVSSLEDIAIANNAGYKAYWKAHEGDVYIITRISGAPRTMGLQGRTRDLQGRGLLVPILGLP